MSVDVYVCRERGTGGDLTHVAVVGRMEMELRMKPADVGIVVVVVVAL